MEMLSPEGNGIVLFVPYLFLLTLSNHAVNDTNYYISTGEITNGL